MSAMTVRWRINKLEAAALASDCGRPACVWLNGGESKEKGMARWLAARPGQGPVRDGRKVIFIHWETAVNGANHG